MRTGFMILSRTKSVKSLTIGKHSLDSRRGCGATRKCSTSFTGCAISTCKRRPPGRRVGFYGLDLYSLFTSIHCVLNYLDRVDPEAAAAARVRYGCLTPWEGDPATYGRATLTGRYRSCEGEVVRMLQDLSQRRVAAAVQDGEDLFDAQLNARLVADAEQYYRIMYYGSDESWNHRDTHMFETLRLLLGRYGSRAKAVVWDTTLTWGMRLPRSLENTARSTSASFAGRHLARMSTRSDRGPTTEPWRPHRIGKVRWKSSRFVPHSPDSYERLMHLTEMDAFFLPLVKIAESTVDVGAGANAVGTGHRRDLSPGNGTTKPLFRCLASQPVRRMDLVRRDLGRPPAHDQQSAEHEPPHPFAVIDE